MAKKVTLDTLMNAITGLSKRFDSLETRFDSLETRFDGLENRFDRLENEHKKTRKMISSLKKQNRQDHNMIIGNFDNRIAHLEKHTGLTGGLH